MQDNPKNVETDWIQDYNQRLVPNAYTALSPYIAGGNTAPNLELKEVEGYGGRFWVSAAAMHAWRTHA